MDPSESEDWSGAEGTSDGELCEAVGAAAPGAAAILLLVHSLLAQAAPRPSVATNMIHGGTYKTSQGTKRLKGQNVPKDKTSQGDQ